MSDKKNFFAQFRDGSSIKTLTASQFAEVWAHYDKDDNGFIEGEELDVFLKEFMSTASDGAVQEFSNDQMKSMREEFLKKYDENKDMKIEIAELANILPEEENFLLLFRRVSSVRSSQQFMQIWKKFDKNNNGFIEVDELQVFLGELLKDSSEQMDANKLKEYSALVVKLFDRNKDGKLQLSELAKLLATEENHLTKPLIKCYNKLTIEEMDKVFNHYDKDGNGNIEDDELEGFMKDLLDLMQETYTMEDLQNYKKVILEEWDVDHDGKISRDEMKMILMQHKKIA